MFSTTLDLIMKIRTLFILLILLLGFVPTNAEPALQIMTVAFLDVGQGDATLIRDGNGFDVLVDGGKKGASDYLIDYMKEAGVDDLEMVVATHADRDHIGGLIGVIESNEIPVESVYYNGYPGTTQTWIEFTDAVNTAGLSLIEANYPDTFTWGGINVQVLNPVEGLIDPDQNKASVVLHIDYANSSVFLPADIDTSIENQLSTRAATLAADILKIAHHGSKNSTSEAFLSAVMPQEAIISVGPNGYGHPAIETISRLDANDVGIWRTDAIGTIFLSTDGESIEMLPKLVFIPNAMNSFKHEEDQ
jgi:beta-lactamase superfamily II metal-dependent hydrolase